MPGLERRDALLTYVCVAVALAHAAWYGHVTSDDAFISLRYARNLAEGYGLVFNPGGERVEGFSNPAFTLVCALLLRLGIAPLFAAKLVGLLGGAAAVWLAARLAVAMCPGVSAGATAALLLAASAFSAVWMVAGLETMPHAALVALATLVTGFEAASGRVRWSPFSFLAVAASRPEGALLAAAAACTQLIVARRGGPHVVARWTLAFAVPAAALIAARYAYFGALVANTFGAKVFFGSETLASGIGYLIDFAIDGGIWVTLPAVAGAILSTRKGDSPLFPAGEKSGAVALVAMAVVGAQLAFIVLVGGDAMLAYRFVMPVYPLLAAFAAVALGALASRTGTRARATVAVAVAIVSMVHQAAALERSPRRFWLAHDRPGFVHLFDSTLAGTWLEGHMECARFIRKRAEPDDVLVVTEAGVLPFATGLETVDLLGLNDRAIAVLWQKSAAAIREARQTGLPPLRQWPFDVADRALRGGPRWVVLDGHIDEATGTFVPRLDIGRWVMSHLQFVEYREVFRATIYDGAATGLGWDRVELVFERRVATP